VHLKVASLLRRPVGVRISRAGADPDPPCSDVDEDQEIQVDHTLDGPFPFADEVALPERIGVAL